MTLRKLGQTDLSITPIGIGAWAIGGGKWEFAWGHQDDAESIVAIHAGLDPGMNWIDTAARFLWAWFSDAVGRKAVFLTMFVLQAVAFLLLSHVSGFVSLAVLAFVILLCYGGGFGTMPSFAADYFGAKDIGSIYGLMLTAWGAAAIVGPTFIAHVRQATGEYQGALEIMALMTLLSAIVPLLLHPPALGPKQSERERVPEGVRRRVVS